MLLKTRGILAAAVIGVGALTGSVAGERTNQEISRTDAFLQRYSSVLRAVVENGPPVEASDLVYSSLDGMAGLLDPHTNFLRPDVFAHMRERQQGSFHGIGVIISLRAGRVTVITPIEGTPAARVGLRAGDVIESVDGESTENMDLDEVARRLRGPEGTAVKVVLARPGMTDAIEVSITRARVPTESVRYAFMLDNEVAYIRVGDFTRTTGAEVKNALDRLLKQGATKLLLDLRDNPGGIVDSAVELAGLVLEPGEQVFSTKGRTADSFQDYRVARDGLHFAGPVVVLVNRGSASAAEIVAGAIQDHDRGLIVGETTFGKGVVQTIYPVRDAGIALTTAKYYTPSGRCIQRDFDSYFTYIRHSEEPGDVPEAELPPAESEREVFSTEIGRKVFGGGGIVPDHDASLGQFSEPLVKLVGNSAFFQFAVSYLSDKDDKAAAARAFVADEQAIAVFRARAIKEKWLTESEVDSALADPTSRRDIELSLRAEILNAGVSLAEGYRTMTGADEQVRTAMTLFDEAAQLNARADALEQAASADRGKRL